MSPDDIISDIIRREGGTYTDAAADRGGPTKWGITLAALQEVRPGAAADDVRLLTEDDARAIYAARFIHKPGFDQIADMRLRAEVVDWGVNSGAGAAAKALQTILAVIKPTGVLSPANLAAINHLDPAKLYCAVLAARLRFLAAVISHDPTQAKWAAGWMNRVAEFVEA